MDQPEPMDVPTEPPIEPAAPHRGGFLASALVRRVALGMLIAVAVSVAVLVKIGVAPVLAVGAGIVRLVTEGAHRTERRVVSEADGPPIHDALADLPADVREQLLDGAPLAGDGFRYRLGVPPEAICARIADAGIPNPGWTERGPGDWQCMSELVPVPGTKTVTPDPETLPPGTVAEPARSTVFFVARGPDRDTMQVVRFKLNLDDPSVEAAGRAMILRLLRDLAGPLSWSLPAEVQTAIERHRRLVLDDRGVIVQVHPETGPVKRLNVVLVLARPAGRLPADRFVEARPIPEAMTGETGSEAPRGAPGAPDPVPPAPASNAARPIRRGTPAPDPAVNP